MSDQLSEPDSKASRVATRSSNITTRAESYSRWYQDVIAAGELVADAPVRGCFILRPEAMETWELIQRLLDPHFKAVGVRNAYFPLLIPQSYIQREAQHIEGFSPELAVVTHGGGQQLEEPLVIRPTSETIIWATLKNWVQSYRDLPLLLNQWCNVMRWERRPRAFLRTTEFLWQEGHTAHATAEDARAFALTMLRVYADFADDVLALSPLVGEKPPHERFAGAVATFSLEPMMQDGRALQAGTSHDLGDNFGRAFDVSYQGADGGRHSVYATSWGMSTRLIGGLVMAHADDAGLIMPPMVAPHQVVIVPIPGNKPDTASRVMEAAQALAANLRAGAQGVRVHVDNRDAMRPGVKFYEWERKGVPLRIEIGNREVTAGQATATARLGGAKAEVPLDAPLQTVIALLGNIQRAMRDQTLAFRESRTMYADTREDIEMAVASGYAHARWCEDITCAEHIQETVKATVRCFPLERTADGWRPEPEDPGPCAWCGGPARRRVTIARSY